MGKGSKRRPLSVPREVFEDNWDRIFSTKDEKPKVRKMPKGIHGTQEHKDKTKEYNRKLRKIKYMEFE
jgi:hypothetical protein